MKGEWPERRREGGWENRIRGERGGKEKKKGRV